MTRQFRCEKRSKNGSISGNFSHCVFKLYKTYPDKDKNLRITDSVLSFSHPYHWELSGTLAFRYQLSDL